MIIKRIEDMVGGWFVGDFEPTAFEAEFEVGYKKHKKDEIVDPHFHALSTEINLLLKGSMKINDKVINEGDVFIIEPFYLSIPKFLTDCEIVVVKTVSDTNDKYCVEIENDF